MLQHKVFRCFAGLKSAGLPSASVFSGQMLDLRGEWPLVQALCAYGGEELLLVSVASIVQSLKDLAGSRFIGLQGLLT